MLDARWTVPHRVWEEVVDLYGHNPRIVHTRFVDLSSSGRDERAEVLSQVYGLVPKRKLIEFVPTALQRDLDKVNGNWDTGLLKILLKCLQQSSLASRGKSDSSTLPSNVEVPAFGQLNLEVALVPNSLSNTTGLASSTASEARDEMSENCRSDTSSRPFSTGQPPAISSPPVAARDSSTALGQSSTKTSPTPTPASPPPPPPPPVLDPDEELKHQIAIARAKRDNRRIIDQESTVQERMSLEGRKCLLEEVEFDLEAQKAEQVLEDVWHDVPFEKDVATNPDPGMSRKRKIGALEVERAERRYEVAKAMKLDGKA